MALQATTLTNSSGGSTTTTANSHDGNVATWDRAAVAGSGTESLQWGFSGGPLDWKKFQLQISVSAPNYGKLRVYIIPTGKTDPADYALVYSNSGDEFGGSLIANNDITYEHGSTISADGIYIEIDNEGSEGAFNVDTKELDCWDVAAIVTPNNFKGIIDEVRIYNRALGAAEIKDIYNRYKKK